MHQQADRLAEGRKIVKRQIDWQKAEDCQEADRLAEGRKIVKRQTDWQEAERLSRGRQTGRR